MNSEKNNIDISAHINLKDPSLWAVIGGNILSILIAYFQGWDMGQIMWVYWAQSVIIGILNVYRMMSLEDFSTDGFTMNDTPVPETLEGKRSTALFFTFHYGFFHFIYAVFLWSAMPLNTASMHDLLGLMACIFTFFSVHRYSLRYNAKTDFKQQKPNLGTLMFYPYMRIIPMHLTIIFGQMSNSLFVMLLFMGLKTCADAGMHMVEHYLFKKPGKDRLRMKN